MGRIVAREEFSEICLTLQRMGAENINIVTGSHAALSIVEGLKLAKSRGLDIPCLWNSSAYETLETLELLGEVIDMYLPDLKTLDTEIAKNFFNAADYPFYARNAIIKMMELSPRVIVRHLVLPGYLESTKSVLEWFALNAKDRAHLSLMTQYTPVQNSDDKQSIAPGRFINREEYETVLDWLDEFEIEDGFYQELETGSDWLPDFNRTNPFSSDLSLPVWHWKSGFLTKAQ
jgi:putative pyruvate formate lyase activating enzyme